MIKPLLASMVLVSSAANAGAHFPPAGMLPLPQPVITGSKPEPSKVSVRYDSKRDRYCVTPDRAATGTRITRTVCRTKSAWDKSGELLFPVS